MVTTMAGREALLEKINKKQELEAELKEQMEILRTVSGISPLIKMHRFNNSPFSEQYRPDSSPGGC